MKDVAIYGPNCLRVSSLRNNRLTLWDTVSPLKLRLDVEVLRVLLIAVLVPELPMPECLNLTLIRKGLPVYSTEGTVFVRLTHKYFKATFSTITDEKYLSLRAFSFIDSTLVLNRECCASLLEVINTNAPHKE